ncbi:MAG: PE family protein, partial [Mycobacterium sp.]
MESVYVDESATAAIGGQVAQLAARGLSSESAVAAPLTALPPAGADPVSLQAAAAFAAQGAQMLAFDAQAQDFLAQAGAALTEIAATYAAADGASAGTLEAAGTRVAGTPTVALGTPINPNGPPPITGGGTLLTPIAPPTPIDSGYTPTNPSGPVNPLTPIAPPTPIDPNGPVTPDTTGNTNTAAAADAGTAAAADAGTA